MKTEEFKSSLERIRANFLLPGELPYIDFPADSRDVLMEIAHLAGESLTRYASSLGPRKLLFLLQLLPTLGEDEPLDKLEAILKMRMSGSIIEAYWALLQFNHTNPSFLRLLGVACKYLKKNPHDKPNELLLKLSDEVNPILSEKILNIIKAEKDSLEIFFEKYFIMPESPLAIDIYRGYFRQCSKDDFIKNKREFIRLVLKVEAAEAAEFINIYIRKQDADRYLDDINEAVIGEYGLPGEGGTFWDNIGKQGKQSFKRWTDLKKMGEHFGKDSVKYDFWSKYVGHTLDVERESDKELLFIHFGNFVIVDKSTDSRSYLYKKGVFEREYKEYVDRQQQGDSDVEFIKVEYIRARDVIIEDMDSDVIRLNYENAGRLYIRDVIKERGIRGANI